MGYTTELYGKLKFDRPVSEQDKEFLDKLASTRRMARNVGPEYGVEGEFYVEGKGMFGQDRDDTIIDYNRPPRTQPGLWLQWVVTDDRQYLEWDGNEKFYYYVEWIEYLINTIFPFLAKRSGEEPYVLNGEIEWSGEEDGDIGKIIVEQNHISTQEGVITYIEKQKEPEVNNHQVWLAIHDTLSQLGLEHQGGGDSNGGFEDTYTKGDYKITIEMRN